MTNHFPIRPDAMPLREALRALRHVLRRGGETLAETLPTQALPAPAATLANAVLRQAREMAHHLDEAVSGLAKSILGGHSADASTLADIAVAQDADARFAQSVYVALRFVLRRLGADGVYVSEAAARQIYARAVTRPSASPSHLAAALTLDLVAAGLLRGAAAEDAGPLPGPMIEPVAVFAVLLWLQSARSDAENEAALDAATDLALAISPEVVGACAAGDAARLAALFDQYVPHV